MNKSIDGNVRHNNELTEENRDLFDRFENTYNLVDRHLRKVLKYGRGISFSHIVREYGKKKPAFAKEADYLHMISGLRNVLIHEKCEPYKYIAIPTIAIVERLESILDKLTHPKLAIPMFQKKVDTLSPVDNLADVFKLIADKGFSQFPIYDNGNFKGVLTENGITRWLAYHVSKELSLVELEDIPVKNVLDMEEKRSNCTFVSRNIPVDEIIDKFSNSELLEVVLITEGGKRNEKLMGIVTRWDILTI